MHNRSTRSLRVLAPLAVFAAFCCSAIALGILAYGVWSIDQIRRGTEPVLTGGFAVGAYIGLPLAVWCAFAAAFFAKGAYWQLGFRDDGDKPGVRRYNPKADIRRIYLTRTIPGIALMLGGIASVPLIIWTFYCHVEAVGDRSIEGAVLQLVVSAICIASLWIMFVNGAKLWYRGHDRLRWLLPRSKDR